MKTQTVSLVAIGLIATGASHAAKYNITRLPLLPGGTFSISNGINKQ